MDKWSQLEEHYKLLELNEDYMEVFLMVIDKMLTEDISRSKKIIDRMLSIAEEHNYPLVKGWAYFYLGWYYHDICNYDNAIYNHIVANEIFEKLDNKKGLVFISNALMADYMKLGIYDLAIETGLKGINLSKQDNNSEFVSSILLNIVICYIRLGLYKDARESIDYFEALSFKISMESRIILYNSKAELELYDNNLAKSKEYINEAYNLAVNNSNILLEEVLHIRGRVFVEQGLFNKAEEDFNIALNYASDRSSIDTASHILKEWGTLLFKKGQVKESKDKIFRALEISKSINYKILIGEIYKVLADIYKYEEDYKSATEALELYYKYDRELFNKQSNLWIRKLQDNQVKREAETYKSLYEEIALLSSIGQKITSDLNMENVVKILYDEVKKNFNLDVLGILLYEDRDKKIDCSYFMENGKRINAGEISVDDESSYAAYCIKNKETIIVNNDDIEYVKYLPNREDRQSTEEREPKSLLYSPLIVGGNIIGVLSIQCYERNMYTVNDLNKIKILASYLAIAIENSKLFKEVEFFATHDYLTGCLNRKVILEKGERAFYRLNRYSEEFSIIMGDVDNFKLINDTYGHLTGDEVLGKVADIIKKNIRNSDYVGRYGGEEFLIVLPHTRILGAKSLAERIRKEIEETVIKTCGNKSLNISISLGLFQFDESIKSFQFGMAAADKALYESKSLGKNRVQVYGLSKEPTS